MRVGILACEIFKHEIDDLIDGDDDFTRVEYLEFALHKYPEDLKATVIEKANDIGSEVDALFLGYGHCQSLQGITDHIDVPSIMLDVEDCIAVMLTQEGYAREKCECPGTWFSSPGWAEQGIKGIIKELNLDCMESEGFDADYFLDIIFDGYTRCLHINTGVGCREKHETSSKELADRLGLIFESCEGSTEMIKEALTRTKKMANSVEDT